MLQVSLEKYRKAGQSRVEAEGHVFIVQRPSAADVAAAGVRVSLDWALRFVVGWEQVAELDLIPGGDPEPVAFDAALCAAWVKDRPSLWQPILDEVVGSYRRYEEEASARGKL